MKCTNLFLTSLIALAAVSICAHATPVQPVDGTYYDTAQPGTALTLAKAGPTTYFGILVAYDLAGNPAWETFLGEFTPNEALWESQDQLPIGFLDADTVGYVNGQPIGGEYSAPTPSQTGNRVHLEFTSTRSVIVTLDGSILNMRNLGVGSAGRQRFRAGDEVTLVASYQHADGSIGQITFSEAHYNDGPHPPNWDGFYEYRTVEAIAAGDATDLFDCGGAQWLPGPGPVFGMEPGPFMRWNNIDAYGEILSLTDPPNQLYARVYEIEGGLYIQGTKCAGEPFAASAFFVPQATAP